MAKESLGTATCRRCGKVWILDFVGWVDAQAAEKEADCWYNQHADSGPDQSSDEQPTESLPIGPEGST